MKVYTAIVERCPDTGLYVGCYLSWHHPTKSQTLQKLQEETEKEIERLRETILHKAFQGEL